MREEAKSCLQFRRVAHPLDLMWLLGVRGKTGGVAQKTSKNLKERARATPRPCVVADPPTGSASCLTSRVQQPCTDEKIYCHSHHND